MRLDFWRRRAKMLRFRSDAQRMLDRTAASAGPVGIDSVDLPAAVLDEATVGRIIDEVSGGKAEIRHAAASRVKEPDEEGGFTLDGKAAIEATVQRALARQENASIEDLLVGLATADCEARRLLNGHGITAHGLEARSGRAT